MHDDNALMKRAKNGDRHAFELVVAAHRKSAILFAYSILSDYDFAEDVAQDAFVKIYLFRNEYKDTFTFKTYLYTLIRNLCIDHLRKMKRGQALLKKEQIYELSAEEELLYEERYEEICKLLKSLRGNQRTALYLYAVNGCSYKEIATIMNKSEAQIKITIYRARKKLKKMLEEEKV